MMSSDSSCCCPPRCPPPGKPLLKPPLPALSAPAARYAEPRVARVKSWRVVGHRNRHIE